MLVARETGVLPDDSTPFFKNVSPVCPAQPRGPARDLDGNRRNRSLQGACGYE